MHPTPGSHPSPEKSRRQKLTLRTCAAAIMVLALVVSIASLALATAGFPDVPAGHPYYAAITDLASRGIIGGYGDGDFGPDDPVTRQQFAKMIVGAGGYPVSESDVCTFTDVVKSGLSGLFPDNYIAVCAAHGITTGKTATAFDPGGKVTRYQVTTMVIRAAKDLELALLEAVPPGWKATNDWDKDAVHGANAAQAEYNGLLAGLNLSALDPYGDMSRGEVAQVLYNLSGRLVEGSTTTTTAAPSTTTTSAPTTTTIAPTTTTTAPRTYQVVDIETANERLAIDPQAQLLDVRQPAEWLETGIISGSVLISLAEVEARALIDLVPDNPVFVICKAGSRSRLAADTLVRLGFGEVYVVEGGIMAWLQAGLPVEQPELPDGVGDGEPSG